MSAADSEADRALLRQIAADLAALRAAVERVRPRSHEPDPAGLLRAISAVTALRGGGHATFSVTELLARAALVPGGEVLRSAIVGQVGALNGRRLGKLLRRIEGETFDGMRIERVGADRDGVVWALRVCGFQTREPAVPVSSS